MTVELDELVAAALADGATADEIEAALGLPPGALAPDAPPETTDRAESVVRQQIARAERAVAAAEAAGDTAGARVWAGIVSRLVPLLVRLDEARDGDGILVTRADVDAATAKVTELAKLAVEQGKRK